MYRDNSLYSGWLRVLPLRVGALALLLSSITRIVLWSMAGLDNAPLSALPQILLWGLLDDLRATTFILIPFWVRFALIPTALSRHGIGKSLRNGALFLTLFLMCLSAVSEVVFWQEFSTRFNFIAVDYLLYTHEVVNNIIQSYPVGWIFAGLGIFALLLSRLCLQFPASTEPPTTIQRFIAGLSFATAVPFCVASLPTTPLAGDSVYTEELSRNGLVSLARAAFQNELEYHRFYKTLPREKANQILTQLGVHRVPLGAALSEDAMMDIADDELPFEKRPTHVVLITVESLSADYLNAFGNTRGLTPNLDGLAREGVLFTKLLATGTRTVRGLEAVSLGTPPIPGQAIVRRPHIEHLSTLGEIVARQGVQPFFLYGGNGFFDNMNTYFAGNAYRIIDRKDIPDKDVTFENAWGVADEVLYSRALREIDSATSAGKRILAHIMTTSNHRPYTYPDGRIDIRSPGGREGAVKYSDWAIGEFLRQARDRPWFGTTLFIILADHCASAAGKTRLPIDRYRIPMIFYAPKLLKPGTHDFLTSQIDLPPTILEVMGLKGDDHFFGRSIYESSAPFERAFVSNYQELGYLRKNTLTVLRPKGRVESYQINPETFEATPAKVVRQLRDEAIAYYQTAADAFREGQLALP